MKKLAILIGFLTAGLLLGSCEKQNLDTDNSKSSYYLSKKGQVETNLHAQIYQVHQNDEGLCTGYFISSVDKEFTYLLEIKGGIPDSILNDPELKYKSFVLDIEYLGIAYNCDQSFKKPNGGNSSPIEIQQVIVTRIDTN